MNENELKNSTEPGSRRPFYQQKKFRVQAGTLAVAFLIGFVPMWLKTIRLSGDCQEARNEIKIGHLESLAAAAVIDARRGQYEPARQNASLFFTTLREEIDRGSAAILNQTQRAQAAQLTAKRDDIITLLARGDPAAGERLTEAYLVCRKILRGG